MEKRIGEVVIGDVEKRIVRAVFSSLLEMDYNDLNKFLGSETIREMTELNSRLSHEGYCIRHGIEVEDMTADDYEAEYEEEWCW